MLRIANQQQWEQRFSSESVQKIWGDPETIASKVTRVDEPYIMICMPARLQHPHQFLSGCQNSPILKGGIITYVRIWSWLVCQRQTGTTKQPTQEICGVQCTVLALMMLLNKNSNRKKCACRRTEANSLTKSYAKIESGFKRHKCLANPCMIMSSVGQWNVTLVEDGSEVRVAWQSTGPPSSDPRHNNTYSGLKGS